MCGRWKVVASDQVPGLHICKDFLSVVEVEALRFVLAAHQGANAWFMSRRDTAHVCTQARGQGGWAEQTSSRSVFCGEIKCPPHLLPAHPNPSQLIPSTMPY